LPDGPSPRAALMPMILYFLATRNHKQIVRQKVQPARSALIFFPAGPIISRGCRQIHRC
jgi:hypothetical protein